ncbi:hypothetical protein BGX30_009184 [Mortierella sp. GBA39]|nr:hypothetical protein BGX30_009184 [Mortierella sp. GBA39]
MIEAEHNSYETAKDRTPFSITELRHWISLFVTVKDVLVSKTWTRDYLPIVWSQVDFDSESQLPITLRKLSQGMEKFLQIVKNAKTLSQQLSPAEVSTG